MSCAKAAREQPGDGADPYSFHGPLQLALPANLADLARQRQKNVNSQDEGPNGQSDDGGQGYDGDARRG